MLREISKDDEKDYNLQISSNRPFMALLANIDFPVT